MIKWISPEKLGASTTKVSTDFLKQNGIEVVSEWYHSPHGVDLFIWNDGQGRMLRYQFSLLGLIVEWNINEGLKTGMIVEEEATNPLNKISTSDLINEDEFPLKSTLEYAFKVLSEMKDLSTQKKQRMLEDFGSPFPQARGGPSRGILSYLKSWFKP
jgi:hypothetical protein